MTSRDDSSDRPRLSGVVVHWRGEEHLAALVAAWPEDGRFELIVVDNSGGAGPLPPWVRCIDLGTNLGFAGGANRGVAAARAPWVLLLNPDARPLPGALERLLEGFAACPEAAGLVPSLWGPDGAPQHEWQLRPLPSPLGVLLQTLLLPGVAGPRRAPEAGAAIEQPAAAALALRRRVLRQVGGLDEGYFPAWFEDVDLARRLAAAGAVLRYYPAARFEHAQGATVPRLGYGPFLWIYYRNLHRYLRLHHGRGWATAARALLPAGLGLRLLLLPLRRPKRARSRPEAARGLLAAAAGAITGWRRPRSYRRDLLKDTAASTPANTPTNMPTNTPTNIPTNIPTNTQSGGP